MQENVNSRRSAEGCGYIPLFEELNQMQLMKDKIIIAIEGGSASGKTTLAQTLQKLYGCAVFHMDDFFLQPHMRTTERLNEACGNVDRERFEKEVLIPLSKNEPVLYRKYDCKTNDFLPTETVIPKKITVIEGAYCMYASLSEQILRSFRIFRYRRRNSKKAHRKEEFRRITKTLF